MKSAVTILIFSAIVFTSGSAEKEEEDETTTQGFANKMEDMLYCLNQEKVKESEMKNFLFAKEPNEVKDSLKKAILCFAKRINFFDGINWNMTVIEKSEAKNQKMLKAIKNCLERDDPKKQPHERAYFVQKCLVDKEQEEMEEQEEEEEEKE